MTVPAQTVATSIRHVASPRPWRSHPPAPPVRLEEDWAEPPLHFRLVLPRAKRNRLDRRAQALRPRRTCCIAGCGAESLAVLLIESETEALLCPFHELVQLDGAPVQGEPLLAVPSW
ncbi:MAG TPA: hypothetical protein VGL99_20820 [Chloroflexota bacterium]